MAEYVNNMCTSCLQLYMSKTYQPKKRKRARTHGFLVRSRSKTGRNTLLRRRRKGRKAITTV